LKKPPISPQLSAVIQNVAFNIDWEDFTTDLKSNYPNFVKVVCLKNRKLQDHKLVKIAIRLVKIRNEILEHEFITVANTRHKVVEYLALANVLICSRCMGIGHFQKNCPQQDQVTCKTCGEKCSDIADHVCSVVPKCIHCEEVHRSNDSKCSILKDYRVALTRTLLTKPPVQLMTIKTFHHGSLFSHIYQFKVQSIRIKFSRKWKRKVRQLVLSSNRSKPKCSSAILKINAI
jgi:hypothetical protein